MLENYLLEELVTFARVKTLAKTAAALHVTQPTVTRGMQKLEEELNVTLFDRQPNRITLTATGELAAKEAAKVLAQQTNFVQTIQNFDQHLATLPIEATVPGPLILLDHHSFDSSDQLAVNHVLIAPENISNHLTTRQAKLIFSNQDFERPTIESRFVGIERLNVHLQKFMYQANQPSITFKELRGLNFVVLSVIGNWKDIIQREIPEATFMYQTQHTAFTKLTTYTDFPYFSSNLTPLTHQLGQGDLNNDNRVTIPISDASAHMPIYASYLKTERKTVTPLLDQLSAVWSD